MTTRVIIDRAYLQKSLYDIVNITDIYYKHGTDIVYKVIDEGLINSEILRTLDGYLIKSWLLLICVTCCIICSVGYQYKGRVRPLQSSTGCITNTYVITTLCDMAKTAFTMGLADQVIHHVETQNVDVNARLLYNGLTVFLSSCLSGNKRLINFMLSKGGDVKSTTMAGDTSLYLAAFAVINSRHSDCSVLEDIILAGCDINRANTGGYTPLHRAAGGGDIDVVKLLMKYGANPYKFSAEGIYPVDIAINNGHLEAAELLQIRIYNPHVWDVIDPHTPPHIKMRLLSPKRNHLIESSRKYFSPKLKAVY